nr:protein phosphatase 2C domain-containing protein [Paraburkholderia youngii]
MQRSIAHRRSVGARSETGYVRSENQDRMCWMRVPLGDVFIVSDGAGGHAGGALAAAITVRVLQAELATLADFSSAPARLARALAAANEAVYRRGHSTSSGNPASMCATAVVLVATHTHMLVAHVGDSRAYRFSRDGGLELLTRDHSRVQRLVDSGQLAAADALSHPESNVLERAIGFQPSVDAEIGVIRRIGAHDTLLLCSDGLNGYIDEARIASVLAQEATGQRIADSLVALALDAGGEDNVTILVVREHARAQRGRTMPRALRLLAMSLLLSVSHAASMQATSEYPMRPGARPDVSHIATPSPRHDGCHHARHTALIDISMHRAAAP